jgi:hypothetical protein
VNFVDLEPQFLKRIEPGRWRHVHTIAEAEGVQFLCPTCFAKNNGPVGTHAIVCWNLATPPEISPGPGRWDLHGTGYADLTLVGASTSSVWLTGEGCGAHFHVTNGVVTPC